jgi:hypothetical protein
MLLSADTNPIVKMNACYVLGKMAEKTPTDDVINKLLILLGDTNPLVRTNACYALGKMAETIPTDNVINKLLILLGDTFYLVRATACDILGSMGVKVASKEVIKGLKILLGDTNDDVRWGAYRALEKMDEQVSADEMMGKLLDVAGKDNISMVTTVCRRRKEILDLLACISEYKDDTVRKLSMYNNEPDWWFLENINPEKCITAFLETGIFWWLSFIRRVFIVHGYGVSLTEASVIVHGREESVELDFPRRELREQLQDYFVNSIDKLLQIME